MRRTAVISSCIAAFALLTSALGAPAVVPPKAKTASAASIAADRTLRRTLRRVAPVATPVRRQLEAATARPLEPGEATRVTARQSPSTHVVQPGEALWTISRRYGLTVDALAAANRVRLTSILRPGQELTVPASDPTSGASAAMTPPLARAPVRPAPRPAVTTHVVRSGETLWDIARRYGTRVEDLMTANDLGHSDWIKPGQRLQITRAQVPRHRQVTAQTRSGRSAMADTRVIQAAGPFLWPARGILTSRFGWRYRRHHDGIDIAAPRGTPIYAARDGVVTFAGWKGGYGRVVFLDHGAGVVTVYGHASRLTVREGERVKRGQLIATVGCTGSCTGSHVHFEVRVDGAAQIPLPYLTAAQAKR